jgi:hypothetical protein
MESIMKTSFVMDTTRQNLQDKLMINSKQLLIRPRTNGMFRKLAIRR